MFDIVTLLRDWKLKSTPSPSSSPAATTAPSAPSPSSTSQIPTQPHQEPAPAMSTTPSPVVLAAPTSTVAPAPVTVTPVNVVQQAAMAAASVVPATTSQAAATVAQAATTSTSAASAPHVSFWHRVEAEALRLFHLLPKWEVVAADSINVAAGLTMSILAVEDPAVASEAAPIIAIVQTKLAQSSTLINGLEKSTSLTSLLTAIQSSMSSILDLASVKNSTHATQITQQVNLFVSVIGTILAAVGTPTAAGVVTPSTPSTSA